MEAKENMEIVLDGQPLAIEDVVAVARRVEGKYPTVSLGENARRKIIEMRKGIEALIDKKIMYGINTGAGINRNEIVPVNNLLGYQRDYILAHCVGSGAHLAKELVRAMMLLRVNSFTFGHSGVTVELCEAILRLLNLDVIPVIPEFGSLGASGDLAPLAHLGAVLIGHQDTKVNYCDGPDRSTKEVFDELGIQPIKLQPKEAMALTNGSTLMLAYSCLAVFDARDLFRIANLAAALNLEAIRGEVDAFDERIHKARGHIGQNIAAADVRNFIDGSQRVTEKAQKVRLTPDNGTDWDRPYERRVQDAYSTRCVPQIHGTFYDALKYMETAVEIEINAATDNSLIFARDNGEYDVLSGGNFHGDPLAVPLDTLTMCLAKIATVSSYRQLRLINTAFSYGLPQDLSYSETTKNTGFMIAQYASVDDSLRIAQLSMPASVFNAPTSGLQEDVVSNGANAAWKNRKAIEYARNVLARELLMSCQAIDLVKEKLGLELSILGKLTDRAFRFIRKYVSMMKQDRYLHADVEEVRKLIVNRTLIKNVIELMNSDES